ncbi:MAG TPA: low affinity iron permease family protein [Myxococcaceae bacterium]|nr:low affinity iron permease family protein [Myxococcaceae bacterium]
MEDTFRRFANSASRAMGTPLAFTLALLVVLVWAVTGPLFHFSDSWQLVINTGTTVVTFLMVFLIQATQNRDATALHLKLDELIRSTREARNTFAALEEASEDELKGFQDEFKKLRDEGQSEVTAALTARQRRIGNRGPSGSQK